MKKLILLAILLIGHLAQSQLYIGYARHGKKTTAQIADIDVSNTSYIYTAYDTDLGYEVINSGAGWGQRYGGAGGLLAANNLSDVANPVLAIQNIGGIESAGGTFSGPVNMGFNSVSAMSYWEVENTPDDKGMLGIFDVGNLIFRFQSSIGSHYLEYDFDIDRWNTLMFHTESAVKDALLFIGTEAERNAATIGANDIVICQDCPPVDEFTSAVDVPLDHQYFGDMVTANTATAYTTDATKRERGGWAKYKINTASQPTIDGGSTPDVGATWVVSTDMYLVIWYDGVVVHHFYLEI